MTGEILAWYRLAARQHTDVQDCMERNSSTEFILWNKFLDDDEYHAKKKIDHGLARIAFEVRRIAKMLGDKSEMPELEDFIPTFDSRVEGETRVDTSRVPEKGKGISAPKLDVPEDHPDYGLTGIELDDEPELDARWRLTNAVARGQWGALLKQDLTPKEG